MTSLFIAPIDGGEPQESSRLGAVPLGDLNYKGVPIPDLSASAELAETRLGFLCSHAGRNLQKVVAACLDGRLDAKPCVVISNNSDSIALSFARKKAIPAYHMSSVTHPDPEELI